MPLRALESSVGQFFRRPLPEIYSLFGMQYYGNVFVIVIVFALISYFYLYLTSYSLLYAFYSLFGLVPFNVNKQNDLLDHFTHYFRNNILEQDKISGFTGGFNLQICCSYLAVWVILFTLIRFGTKEASWLNRVAVVVIYGFLFVLLIDLITLKGSFIGFKYLLWPNLLRIFDVSTWRVAFDQNYFQSIIEYTGSLARASLSLKSTKIWRVTCW